MSRYVVQASGLGKQYRIGALRAPRLTFRELIVQKAAAPVRRLRAAIAAPRSDGANPHDSQMVWALRDASFEVRPGEVVGLIGRNGAGKSTLLKILTRITRPTVGHAEIEGRVGSLLEVGTGFHPELTGRDNVFLNGAILGMDRIYIRRQFDEIVEFSGIGAFIDTPVKRYSSGMYLRLAFAVAAHLEPEVLVVDEVLAVGDAEFQRKCLGKMDDVARDGRTVLFVSHNMNAIQRLCSRCIHLAGGGIVADGATEEIVSDYLARSAGVAGDALREPMQWIDLTDAVRTGDGRTRFQALRYASDNRMIGHRAYAGGPLEFTVALASDVSRRIGSLAVSLCDHHGTVLVNADTLALGQAVPVGPGRTLITVSLDAVHLAPGTYAVRLWLADALGKPVYDYIETAARLEIVDVQQRGLGASVPGLVLCSFSAREVAAPAA